MTDSQVTHTETESTITSGPLLKTVIALSAPVVGGMLMEVALTVTDFYWVGRLGPAAQDAVTSAMIIIWTVFSAMSIISIGITALISRHVGASNPDKAAHYARQALWLATFIGGLVSLIGFLSSPYLLSFMQASEATKAHAVPYLRIFFASSMLLFWAETIYAMFRAAGDTRTPTKVGVTVVLINLVLDPLLIFGWGPFPELGVPGASLATAFSFIVGTTIVLRLLLKGRLGFSVGLPLGERPDFEALKKITRIGLPIGSQQGIFVLVYWFLIGYVHEFGTTAGAAMGIGNRMESFSYLTCYGISIAASTLVGQNLGAGKPDRAARAAWTANGLGVGITLVFTALFIGIPETIAGVFTNDPEVIAITVDYLLILGLSQALMAFEIILEGAFSGAGDTMPPMLVMLPGSLARIPLAWYLAFELGWGINGIWWTLTITTGLKAAILAYWFSRGRWKQKKL